MTPLHNVQPATVPVPVQVANQQYIYSTHMAELPIPNLPTEARITHIFPNLHSSLLAVAPLCDSDCQVTFDKHMCTIRMPDNTTIQCPRNTQGLWTLPHSVLQQAHTAVQPTHSRAVPRRRHRPDRTTHPDARTP